MSKSARPLTGYGLESHFRKLRTRWQFTPLEHYVFSELVYLCNEAGWPAEFNVTNALLMAAVGCSEQGLINVRTRLQQAGLLTYIPGNRRRATLYRFTVNDSTDFSHSVADNLAEGSTQFSHNEAEGSTQFSIPPTRLGNDSTQGSTQGSTEFSPYKEQLKPKELLRKPSLRKAASLEHDATQNAVSFDTFWLAYDKKRDRFKCEKKWAALTAAEQTAALAHVPAYVAATPDKQYRKDPQTYLNGKCWLDEDLPALRHGQPATPALPPPNSPAPAPVLNHAVVAQQEATRQAAQDAHFARWARKPSPPQP